MCVVVECVFVCCVVCVCVRVRVRVRVCVACPYLASVIYKSCSHFTIVLLIIYTSGKLSH